MRTFQKVVGLATKIEKMEKCFGHMKSQFLRRTFTSVSSLGNDFVKNGQSFEESVFEMYKNPESGLVNIGHILTVIERTGVRRGDRRLREMMTNLAEHHRQHGEENTTVDNLNLNLPQFRKMIRENTGLISQSLQCKVRIPDWQPFSTTLTDIFNKCKNNYKGSAATYIPQLGKVSIKDCKYSNDIWAMSVCTIDGQRLSLGDVETPFTMQSCSKPFTYALCLNHLGHDIVHQYIGYEPSGRNFNEICLDKSGKPHNPMLNGGAIMSCALTLQLIQPRTNLAEKYDFLFQSLHRIGGYEFLGFNNSVFLSERETADRNFAMGYFMKENKSFPTNTDLQETLDLYFQSCSLEVNTETLAVMGATLANGGTCPTTGEKVLKSSDVRDVLSLMYSCGMYNYSGEFAFKVGLPAKSGVSGCVLLVVPNLMAVALWSPPLDSLGNSVRGIQFCKELVSSFNFHQFDEVKPVKSQTDKFDPRRDSFEHAGTSVVSLLFAAVAGDVTALQRMFLQGVDMAAADYDGRTALHLAAAEGHRHCLHFLLTTAQLSPQPVDRWGHTPLSEAEAGNHEDCVELLRTATQTQADSEQ